MSTRSASGSRRCARSASSSSASSPRRRGSPRAWCRRSSRAGSPRRSTRWASSRARSASHRVALRGRRRTGRLHVTRRKDYPVVSFDGTSERWHVLGAGLFQGKIRAVVSTLGPRAKGVKTDKVIIEPGQMKLFYVIEGKVALHYNGDRHALGGGRQRATGRRHAARLGKPRRPRRPRRSGSILGLRTGEHGWHSCRMSTDSERVIVDFRTEPSRYRHWKLAFDGPVATLAMDVGEDGGLRPGYELKLNSYDLGVDIELYDADPAPALRASRGRRGDRSPPARSASSAPAPTSACWASRPTAGR